MTICRLQRRRKTKEPCPRCFIHQDRCICAYIPKLNLSTNITLIVHHRELKRTTNTGRLALQALVNSKMIVRGQKDSPIKNLKEYFLPGYEQVLFFPSEDAVEISDFKSTSDHPIQLLVPDGNWRQAAKVHIRHPELKGIPRVMCSQINSGKSHLRKEHFPSGMSTLEAISKALGRFEGMQVEDQLIRLYHQKLNATLVGRGHLSSNYWTIG